MRRSYSVSTGQIEYHKHAIGLNENGKFWCIDLDITADSLDEIKKLIRETESKRAALPRIAAWSHPGWGRDNYVLGATTGVGVGHRLTQVWFTWKEGTDNRRQQVWAEHVYPDTEENRAIIADITTLQERIKELESQVTAKKKQLTHIKVIED